MSDGSITLQIDAFLSETGMAPSSFGRLAVNDWRLIDQLREGRELRRATVKKIRDFMDQHRASLAASPATDNQFPDSRVSTGGEAPRLAPEAGAEA